MYDDDDDDYDEDSADGEDSAEQVQYAAELAQLQAMGIPNEDKVCFVLFVSFIPSATPLS